MDEPAFESVFKTHFSGLCAFASRFISDRDICKEIVHDVFVNLWNKRETVDPEKSLKSYLFTSVNNRCLNYIRDNKKFDKDGMESELLSYDSGVAADQEIRQAELQGKINETLATLPEKCRLIFSMNRFEGKKYQEIADELNISVKTIEAQMSKALRIFREGLAEYLPMILIWFIYLYV